MPPAGGRTTPPIFFPEKENGRCDRPKERRLIGSLGLERPLCLRNEDDCARRRRVSVARRFGLLLLSAAALPILWECTVISVYRQSLQCGERSNAAFRKQSAAEKTSLAPHDSKARLLLVTSSRGSWRSHVHRTYFAQRVQFFELQTANVRGQGARPLAFSWGIKRGPFSHVREWPPLTHPCTVQGNKEQHCRAANFQTIGSSISLVAYAFSAQSARAPARYS